MFETQSLINQVCIVGDKKDVEACFLGLVHRLKNLFLVKCKHLRSKWRWNVIGNNGLWRDVECILPSHSCG